MEPYLSREETISRFNEVADELIGSVKLPLVYSMMAAQFLPAIANAIPDNAAIVEMICSKLASVYGYDVVFVNENYRIARESAAAPDGLLRPFCAVEEDT